jgi:gliding motility-associated protein GldL
MSEKNSKFDIWWTSPGVKRKVGAFYSIGATVVIIGAMFKILHLPGAAIMLGAGMTIEAMLFMLGVLDKPHKEYHWENVFDFDGKGAHGHSTPASMPPAIPHEAHAAPAPAPVAQVAPAAQPVAVAASAPAPVAAVSTGLSSAPLVSEEDAKMLSEGIQNLTKTAQQFTNLANMAGSAEKFSKQIDAAVAVTDSYVKSQEALTASSSILETSYKGVAENITVVENNTKIYAQKIEEINTDLSTINAKSVALGMSAIESSTKQYASSIDKLSSELSAVNVSGFSVDLEKVQKGTKEYSEKVTEVNKNLASINSIYELQLKNIQAQSESLAIHNDKLQLINAEFGLIVGDVQKMKSAAGLAADEAEKFRLNAVQLSKSVADLNSVYGNMLNALS